MDIASSPSTAITSLHVDIRPCIAPARDSPLFSNEPALAPTTGENLSPPPVGSTDLQKTDAAPSAAASSPGNPRESDGPTGDACKSTSGTRVFRTATMYDATIGTRTLGEVRVPRTSEEHLLGRDGTTASAPGGVLGRVTASFGNPRGTDGPSRGGALAEGSAFEEPHLRGRDGTTASAPGGALGRVTASFGNPRGTDKDLLLRSLISGDATVLQPVRPEGHLAVSLRRLESSGNRWSIKGGGSCRRICF